MKTVNSLSGGKTSSFLAVHYPADYELFALVCNDDPKCAHPDRRVMQIVNDKLSKYCQDYGECIGTPENVQIFEIMLNLEQKIGREIIWVRDKSFDEWIRIKKAIPNQNARWCTTSMKLNPIFEWCFKYTDFPVEMRIGFRADELERANRFSTSYKFPQRCNNYGNRLQQWEEIEWRVGKFPLIENHIFHHDIINYWNNEPRFFFPDDSNCQMCFWKHEQQLRKNFDDAPHVMKWAKQKELERNNRFRHKMNMGQIEKMDLQLEFNFGTGSGCQAGFCTD